MSPRKSAEKVEDPAFKEKREHQHQLIVEKVDHLKECITKAKEMRKEFGLLFSVLDGLYVEIDKLCKKGPAEQVTDLVLEQVNDIIRAVKELAKDDPYVQKQKEFVPAGDNAEHRDVIVVLKQLQQGLDRFENTIEPRISLFESKLDEAINIQLALELYLHGKKEIVPKDIENQGYSRSGLWFGVHGYGQGLIFDWDRLDGIDFETYFPTC